MLRLINDRYLSADSGQNWSDYPKNSGQIILKNLGIN